VHRAGCNACPHAGKSVRVCLPAFSHATPCRHPSRERADMAGIADMGRPPVSTTGADLRGPSLPLITWGGPRSTRNMLLLGQNPCRRACPAPRDHPVPSGAGEPAARNMPALAGVSVRRGLFPMAGEVMARPLILTLKLKAHTAVAQADLGTSRALPRSSRLWRRSLLRRSLCCSGCRLRQHHEEPIILTRHLATLREPEANAVMGASRLTCRVARSATANQSPEGSSLAWRSLLA